MKRAALILAAMLAAPAARAGDTAPAAPAAKAAGAVAHVAQQAVSALGTLPQAPLVVAAPLASDAPTTKGDELALRVASLVAGRIGNAARAHTHASQLSAARALAGKSGALVYVQVEIAKGELHATLEVYPAVSNGWDRIRNPQPPPVAHAFGAARIDAEVRAFLPPILLEQASVHKARHEEGEVLAAACGDVDGDGAVELALVSRARVALGRLRGGRFVVERSAAWSALSGRAPAPMREPLGTAVIAPGALYVGSTDRAGVRIEVTPSGFGAKEILGALPVGGEDYLACAAPNAGASAFEGGLRECAAAKSPPTIDMPASRFDAFAATTLIARDGSAHPVTAARVPGGKLYVRFGEEASQMRLMDGVGAQVALADLDQDGVVEVATTQESGTDEIFVNSWTGADPRLRLRIPAPAGVRALAACPAEERGAPALVAVVGGEIWLVR